MIYIFAGLLIVSLVYTGPRQTVNNAIFLILLWIGLRIFWMLLPFLIIFYIIKLFLMPKRTKKRTYYYRYTQDDFDEFFKSGGQNRGYSSGAYQSYSTRSYFEDKSKYYSVLGVDSSASQEDIKKAFRSKAREYHPDKYANRSESEKVEAEKKFKELNEAYDKLKA